MERIAERARSDPEFMQASRVAVGMLLLTGFQQLPGKNQGPMHRRPPMFHSTRPGGGAVQRAREAVGVFEREGAAASAFIQAELRRRGLTPGQTLQW